MNSPQALASEQEIAIRPWRKLNLIYLCFVFFPLIISADPHWLAWATSIAAVALFLPIYWRSYLQSGKAALSSALLIALIGFALMLINPGGGSFIVYAMATLGFHQPSKKALQLGAVLLAASVLMTVGLGYSWYGVLPQILIGVSVLMGAVFGRREWLRNAELRLSRTELERHARNAERERISRDLHDLLGHTLSVIALKCELARKLAHQDVASSVQEIAEVERIARDALVQVREAVTGMRATDFSAELASARVTLMSAGIEVVLGQNDLPILTPPQAQALAMVLREALTNILRHANASRVDLLWQQNDALEFQINDNGKGMNNIEKSDGGNGIAGMRERLTTLHGSLVISSQPGKGTTVLARLPIVQARHTANQAATSGGHDAKRLHSYPPAGIAALNQTHESVFSASPRETV
jgi:two-component system, NarL family, sensor histidine kinase DesK